MEQCAYITPENLANLVLDPESEPMPLNIQQHLESCETHFAQYQTMKQASFLVLAKIWDDLSAKTLRIRGKADDPCPAISEETLKGFVQQSEPTPGIEELRQELIRYHLVRCDAHHQMYTRLCEEYFDQMRCKD